MSEIDELKQRLEVTELALGRSLVANMEIIQAFVSLVIEKSHPEQALILLDRADHLHETFRDLMKSAAPDLVKPPSPSGDG